MYYFNSDPAFFFFIATSVCLATCVCITDTAGPAPYVASIKTALKLLSILLSW